VYSQSHAFVGDDCGESGGLKSGATHARFDRCAIVIIIALVDWHKLGRRRFLPAEKKREERRERVRDGRTSADKDKSCRGSIGFEG
jgi:hypothetical protein